VYLPLNAARQRGGYSEPQLPVLTSHVGAELHGHEPCSHRGPCPCHAPPRQRTRATNSYVGRARNVLLPQLDQGSWIRAGLDSARDAASTTADKRTDSIDHLRLGITKQRPVVGLAGNEERGGGRGLELRVNDGAREVRPATEPRLQRLHDENGTRYQPPWNPTEKGLDVDFYEAAARVKRSLRVWCPSPCSVLVSSPRRWIHGSREVQSSFYSRSSGASGLAGA
jgi:hypothetical protein